MAETAGKIKENYNAEQISILEGLEAVRKRPGMYIGSTSSQGLHHLVYEILDNSVDEAMAGFCNHVDVMIHNDGSVTVKDNGRGIPVDIHPKTGTSALEVVFTVLHAGGKFGDAGYKGAGGLHGVGASVVNALSSYLHVEVTREGDPNIWGMSFEKGHICEPFKKMANAELSAHGTTVRFYPDPEIFSEKKAYEEEEAVPLIFHYETIKSRIREVAFLTKGLSLTLKDERTGKEETFAFDGGVSEYVTFLNKNKKPLFPEVISVSGELDDVKMEVAFQYNTDYSENVIGYVNNIHTPEGGTHVTGFRTSLTKTLNAYAKEAGLIKKKDITLSSEDLKEGLTGIVSVRVLNPEFEGQTKQKLGNSEVRGIVAKIMNEQLQIYLELHPETGKQIVEKALLAIKAREAARKAKDSTRRKTAMDSSALPGKLADCSSRNAEECEIYIVEGDSAGGSAKEARNRRTQAILPLRGKILNIDKANQNKISANAEISAMITAFGTGIKEDFDLSRLRYDKIIIMTDADVDGAHISTLLLTFIYRYMPDLIRTGHVYLAKPPLYKLQRGKKAYYAYSDAELAAIQKKIGPSKGKDLIQRYKGLGEMDASQLWETTMDPETRTLQVIDFDECQKEETDSIFDVLMGDNVAPRRAFIEKNAKFAVVDM